MNGRFAISCVTVRRNTRLKLDVSAKQQLGHSVTKRDFGDFDPTATRHDRNLTFQVAHIRRCGTRGLRPPRVSRAGRKTA
jgi:hypothetical protein